MKKDKLRVVFDTNVFISALYTSGICREALRLIFNQYAILCINNEIVEEIKNVATRPYFQNVITSEILFHFFDLIQKHAHNVQSTRISSKKLTSSDPKDNHIVNCVLYGNASILVTGNKKHFTSSGKDIFVFNAREFIVFMQRENYKD